MKVTYNQLKSYIELGDVTPQELYDIINAKVIEIDDFYQLTPSSNLVIGRTLTKEKHPNADKLNVLTVNVGEEVLQIVCGAPNVDVDQTVIVALPGASVKGHPIKKSTIRDVESNGMICSLTEICEIEEALLPDLYKDGIYVLPDTYTIGEDAIKTLALDDYVYELGLTPNRSDLLSLNGIAKDVAAALNKECKDFSLEMPELKDGITLDAIDENACSYYSLFKIENVDMPRHFIHELMLMINGVKPQDQIVDFSNSVMFLCGQPIHIFDADLIGDAKMGVRFAKQGETINPLVGDKEINLDEHDIVITANDKVVALAGVMGDKEHAVNENTKNIIVEVAVFDSVTIRRTANKYNLRTNASNRFEKGIPYCATKDMQKSIAAFIPGNLVSFVENKQLAKNQAEIAFTVENINKFLGIDATEAEIIEILTNLNFENVTSTSALSPLNRTDIKIKQDLYEEIIRMVGFDKIIPSEETRPTKVKLSDEQKLVKKIRTKLINANLNEVKTYLLDANECANYTMPCVSGNPIKINNAQSKEHEYVITSNIPNLLKVAKYNISRNTKDIQIFEVRKLFSEDKEAGINSLSILMTGELIKNILTNQNIAVDFYAIKAVLWNLLDTFGLDVNKLEIDIDMITNIKGINPYQGGVVKYNNQPIAYIGKLMPNKYIKQDAFAVEMNLDELLNAITKEAAVAEISKFQSIERDLTIEITNQDEYANFDLKTIISELGAKEISDVKLVSYYKKPDCWSISYRLTFVNYVETFKTEDVDKIMEVIFNNIVEKGFTIPGLH